MRQPSSLATLADAAHPRPIIAAHWLTVLALLGAFALVLGRELIDVKSTRAVLMDAHRLAGMLVWTFALLRLALRARLPMADTAEGAPLWQRLIASGTHGLLYLLLLGLPLLGWALTSARGQSVSLFGWGHLPMLMEADLDLADTLEAWHTWLAWGMAGLIGMHAGAAIWHHWVIRDGVLASMLPQLRRRA
jgi:cytochrome b561